MKQSGRIEGDRKTRGISQQLASSDRPAIARLSERADLFEQAISRYKSLLKTSPSKALTVETAAFVGSSSQRKCSLL